ncbi:hypothetical protein [Natrononativus amylolyticus]|uniref:hypothetical protein n=1 Tax=Natrononativus amylolyticus TaxID=2963434 RepID=UPI0020CE9B98|nr:hypothetical protein [Natrononativus amylolyticus]
MYYRDMEHVCRRAETLEREAARDLRLRAEARAVAGREPGDHDEGEVIDADEGEDGEE